MRLKIKWSPIKTVFSIEPLGITRACTSVPSTNTNMSITQNQETTSRQTFVLNIFPLAVLSPARISAVTMRRRFELHELRRIVARVA